MVDTNLLLRMARGGFPLEAEVDRLIPGARVVVPSSVVRELDSLVARRTAGSTVARGLADRFEAVATPRSGDDGVVDVAARTGGVVATADRALQRRSTERGIGVLAPRDRARLELRPPSVRQRLSSAPRSTRTKAA